MNNGMKIKATLFIVLFLVLVATIVYIMQGSGSDKADVKPQTAVAPVQTETPAAPEFNTAYSNGASAGNGATGANAPSGGQAGNSGSAQSAQVPYVTSAPAATPDIYIVSTPAVVTPAPTPVPTPEPTPVPQPAGMLLGNGTFVSSSGALLNIHADWEAAVADDSHITVTVTVYADHYQLHNNASYSLFIDLGDDSQGMTTADIQYDEGTLKSSVLGTATFTESLARWEAKSFPLHVKWNFGGVYGDGHGNHIDVSQITCGGNIDLTR